MRSSVAVDTGNCPPTDVSAPLDFGAPRVTLNDEVIDSLCERMSRRACAPSPCLEQCEAPVGMIAKRPDQPRLACILLHHRSCFRPKSDKTARMTFLN